MTPRWWTAGAGSEKGEQTNNNIRAEELQPHVSGEEQLNVALVTFVLARTTLKSMEHTTKYFSPLKPAACCPENLRAVAQRILESAL